MSLPETAFPVSYGPDGRCGYSSGMSLRDYFAGQVLSGVFVNAKGLGDITEDERHVLLVQVAKITYEMADAMIEARNE